MELLVDFNQMIARVGHQRVFIRGPNLKVYLCIPTDGQIPPGLKVQLDTERLGPRNTVCWRYGLAFISHHALHTHLCVGII